MYDTREGMGVRRGCGQRRGSEKLRIEGGGIAREGIKRDGNCKGIQYNSIISNNPISVY